MKTKAGLLAAALAIAGAVATVAPASAATTNGRYPNALTLTYNSVSYVRNGGSLTGPDGLGSETGWTTNVKDFAPYTFLTSGNGKGKRVKNDATHAFNDNGSRFAYVYYHSYTYSGCYCGTSDEVDPTSGRDLSATYNEDAAFNWVG